MSIWIYSHGTKLNSAEQEAGRAAALAVFANHKADPVQCRDDDLTVDGCAVEDQCAKLIGQAFWREAEQAAIAAATKGWARVPDDLSLGLA